MKELKTDSELHFLMQLAEEKGCWLVDLEDIPSSELPYWIAYYKLKEKERKKQERRAKAKKGR